MINAPNELQKLMDNVLDGICNQNRAVYLGKVLIYNQTFESHFEMMEQIFERLEDANLKVFIID